MDPGTVMLDIARFESKRGDDWKRCRTSLGESSVDVDTPSASAGAFFAAPPASAPAAVDYPGLHRRRKRRHRRPVWILAEGES